MPKITITLALIIAGGLAAGLALARPASTATEVAAVEAAESTRLDGSGRGGSGREVADAYGDPDAAGAEPSSTPAPAAAPAAVTIQDFAFAPSGSATPGQAVTVTNADSAAHTLTFDDGSVDTGTIDGGQAVQIVAPAEAGTYRFFCEIHPSMTGELVVG